MNRDCYNTIQAYFVILKAGFHKRISIIGRHTQTQKDADNTRLLLEISQTKGVINPIHKWLPIKNYFVLQVLNYPN